MNRVIWDKYTPLVRERLSDYRYEHSLNVAREAAELARLYGADEEKAETAGLLHDIMKEASPEEQLYYISLKAEPDRYLLASKKIWHAHAAAAYCEKELGLCSPELLDAIRYHSSGRAGMTLLDRVIYIADYTSAERSYKDVDVMRRLSRQSLEKAMLFALSYTIGALSAKNAPIHPDTVFAYDDVAALLEDQLEYRSS